MRDAVELNKSLKLQLNKSQAERVTDADVLTKLQNTRQELKQLQQDFEQQQQQHEVYNLNKNCVYEKKYLYIMSYSYILVHGC